MRSRKWTAIVMFALGLLTVDASAFENGYIMPPELVDRIQVGVTTSKQVTEILGPPASISQFPRRGVETWNYSTLEAFNKKKTGISIEIDGSGIVRNVLKIIQYGP